ncbi:MAG TPA: pilus assembly protein [Pararobbsia sp.]|jgi:hypothetical protein|nr:pilus assembly protein [Pararobbsia sp.]
MRHLSLDLAPFSVRRELYRIRRTTRVFALVGALLCVWAGVRIHERFDRLDALDRETARLAQRVERFERASKAVKTTPIDVKQGAAVNAAIARLNLPWDGLLDAIEAATPVQIALLSITPTPGRALVRIEAECNTSKDMIDYLGALEQQPMLAGVNLVKHELVKDGGDGVLRFDVEVQWRGTAP